MNAPPPPAACMTMSIKTHSFCRAESYPAQYKGKFWGNKKLEFTGRLESYRALLICVAPTGMIKDTALHRNII